ncbi:hypothetical protein DSO57_1016855 [Entomophthora muscae]|uniref:Uncharacterized protein n=1 Tax=Entomophthora muscae TaxID=34485 RepID=A0ACC2S771_9FUNG|nr:hypothetical protein DSO57_1016855 [Entomophthora muscae]
MFERMNENKKLAKAVADQRLATLGRADNLEQYCAEQRRSIHRKMLLLTVGLVAILVGTIVPMVMLEMWYLASVAGIAVCIYALLLYRMSCSYVDKQTILKTLHESQEERRGSIPPPPQRPPPILTDYVFPSLDGKRGSLVNWVNIDQSRIEFPSTSPPPRRPSFAITHV